MPAITGFVPPHLFSTYPSLQNLVQMSEVTSRSFVGLVRFQSGFIPVAFVEEPPQAPAGHAVLVFPSGSSALVRMSDWSGRVYPLAWADPKIYSLEKAVRGGHAPSPRRRPPGEPCL